MSMKSHWFSILFWWYCCNLIVGFMLLMCILMELCILKRSMWGRLCFFHMFWPLSEVGYHIILGACKCRPTRIELLVVHHQILMIHALAIMQVKNPTMAAQSIPWWVPCACKYIGGAHVMDFVSEHCQPYSCSLGVREGLCGLHSIV